MKEKLSNLLILVLIALFIMDLLDWNNAFDSLLGPLRRNAHFLLILYVLVLYLSDTLKYIKRKAGEAFYPAYVKIRRKIKALFR